MSFPHVKIRLGKKDSLETFLIKNIIFCFPKKKKKKRVSRKRNQCKCPRASDPFIQKAQLAASHVDTKAPAGLQRSVPFVSVSQLP